jgi:hypothetical protein
MSNELQTPTRALLPTFLGVSVVMLVVAAVLIVGLARRPSGGLHIPPGYQVIHVTEESYGIQLPSASIPSGNVVFVDTNRGPIAHELVVFKLESASSTLPLLPDKSVDEDPDRIEAVVDSGSALAPGETRLLTGDLEPGSYMVVCNLAGHYQLGMQTPLTVT